MKSYTLQKHEQTSNGKVLIGSRQIDEPETWNEFIEMINVEKLNAIGDWKSGRRVRIQREIAGTESKQEKLEKLAESYGFNSFDEMVELARKNKSE